MATPINKLREGLRGWGRFTEDGFEYGIGEGPPLEEAEKSGSPMYISHIDYEKKVVTFNMEVATKREKNNGDTST